jgi:uncharacterized protein YuzE
MAGCERILRQIHERKIMKIQIDQNSDALFLKLDDSPIVESEEVSPSIVLDFNESGEVVGIEMLHLSTRSSKIQWNALQFETAALASA